MIVTTIIVCNMQGQGQLMCDARNTKGVSQTKLVAVTLASITHIFTYSSIYTLDIYWPIFIFTLSSIYSMFIYSYVC